MKKQPLVSAILPVYNPRPEWLQEAVKSILNQSYGNIEIIIVNDGSEKSIDKYLNTEVLENSKVELFSQPNQGFTKATNKAIEESKGDYIAPIGQDDRWKPEKIEKQIEEAKRGKEVIFTRASVIDEKGNQTHTMGEFPSKERVKNLLVKGCYPCYESVLIDDKILEGKKLLNENYEIASDLELWLRLLPNYRTKYLNEILTQKREHSDNESKNHKKTLKEEEEIQGEYFEKYNLSRLEKKKARSRLYRGKAKGIFENGSEEYARELWLKSWKNRPIDLRSLILLLTSFNLKVYNTVNGMYSKIL